MLTNGDLGGVWVLPNADKRTQTRTQARTHAHTHARMHARTHAHSGMDD